MRRYYDEKKKKSLTATQDKLDNEKSSSSDNEHANIYIMANIDNKNEVKTCSEFDTSSCSSLDDEEDMPYDVLLQNYHMISLYCKKFKEKFKTFVSKNIELRKSNEDPDSRRESKSGKLIDETSTSEKLREEVA